MYVVIFSGGNVEDGYFVKDVLKKADLIIAADSGAESALQFGFIPNIVVGDFDSLLKKFHEDLIKKEVECIAASAEKNETDTQMAVDIALRKGATEIAILGGVKGNRLDHVLANVFLSAYVCHPERSEGSSQRHQEDSSALPQNDKVKIFFINGNQKSWIVNGPSKVEISGKKGNLLSLIPISQTVSGIKMKGLQYQLESGELSFGNPRGISNVFKKEEVSVEFKKGTLLFVLTWL